MKENKPVPRTRGTLFGLVFLTVGLSLTLLIGFAWIRNQATYSWMAVEALVLESRLEPANGNSQSPTLKVHYEYLVGGVRYESRRFSFGFGLSTSEVALLGLQQQAAQGRRVTAYVNPRAPGEAVLWRGSPFHGLIISLPLVFVGVGGGFLYFIWRTPRPETVGFPREVAPEGPPVGRGIVRTLRLILLLGLVAEILFLIPAARLIRSRNWERVPCEIIEGNSNSGRISSDVEIHYRYTYAGRVYVGNQFSFMPTSFENLTTIKRSEALRLKPGSKYSCYVNPQDPSESVINRDSQFQLRPALSVLPLIGFTLFGFWIVWLHRRRKPEGFTQPVSPGRR